MLKTKKEQNNQKYIDLNNSKQQLIFLCFSNPSFFINLLNFLGWKEEALESDIKLQYTLKPIKNLKKVICLSYY